MCERVIIGGESVGERGGVEVRVCAGGRGVKGGRVEVGVSRGRRD